MDTSGFSFGPVALTVRDLARSLDFYRQVVGLELHHLAPDRARLGPADGPVLLELREDRDALRPGNGSGLYHLALLLPSRPDLARWLRHAAGQRFPLQGYADHLVSEAFYLADPDGNGLEVYRDRPREGWPRDGAGVRMASDPIDLEQFLEEAGATPWQGAPAGTRLGHLHLRVADLDASEEFYVGLLGLQVMARWPGALFVAADGYHHHFGLNVWHGRGVPAPAPGALGFAEAEVLLAPERLSALAARLTAQGWPHVREEGSLQLRDPAGLALRFSAASGS